MHSKALESVIKSIEKGRTVVRVIPARNIAVREWVRLKCMYGCEMFGKSWSCPPAPPSVNEVKDIISWYKKALLIGFETNSLSDQKKTHKTMLEIERKLFLAGFYKAFALFPGPCSFCSSCSYPKPCMHPELRLSLIHI